MTDSILELPNRWIDLRNVVCCQWCPSCDLSNEDIVLWTVANIRFILISREVSAYARSSIEEHYINLTHQQHADATQFIKDYISPKKTNLSPSSCVIPFM
jgi:hypothetical protein